ncbi:MAG: hypothetical protein GC203_10505 [Phenylobacterium sp.]|uniref:hypothetical protein n=1 Tax=Phenylobacterium sp. TaxID=1871053 RepID=UPI0025FB7F93|nr:hypothetical protein [Phenylobacterium sp.]MBI1198282.1 hypothetical protein [Phenylobacterium sp.]
MTHPFAVPASLSPDLARVQAYWRGLLRGAAEMPFADDLRLTDLPDLVGRLLLVEVFQGPERFRFAEAGGAVGGVEMEGLFLDETELAYPLEFLRAQCSATVESARPTCMRMAKAGAQKPYTRLLLPFWGDGRISAILGVVDFD